LPELIITNGIEEAHIALCVHFIGIQDTGVLHVFMFRLLGKHFAETDGVEV